MFHQNNWVMKTRTKMVGVGAVILFLGVAAESSQAQSKDRFDRDERLKHEQTIPKMEPRQRMDQSKDGRDYPKQNPQSDRPRERGSYQSQNNGRGADAHPENRREERHEVYQHRPVKYKYQYWNDHRTRRVTYNYHRHNRPLWAPVYGYRYNTRYIYYRDYNLYYDCYRNMFVVWTGRNWIVTSRVPDFMYRVNFASARIQGVDYWDDDFDYYLHKGRPGYINVYVER